MESEQHSLEEIKALLLHMGNDGRNSRAAEGKLLQMGPEIIPLLVRLSALEEKKNEAQFVKRARRLIMLWAGGALALRLLQLYPPFWLGCFLVLLFVVSFGSCSLTAKDYLVQKNIIALMPKWEDKRAIEYLLDLISQNIFASRNVSHYNQSKPGLAKLLPLITNQDFAALTDKQRSTLRQQLTGENSSIYPEFVIALLDLFTRASDTDSLPAIAFLIQSQAPTINEQRVRKVAQTCLEPLLAKMEPGDVSDIGSMAATLMQEMRTETADWYSIYKVRLRLTRLLPLVNAENASSINKEQRKHLYHALTLSPGNLGPDFHVELLAAIERMEDTGAIDYVRPYAYGEAATWMQKRIRTAARACMAVLQEKSKREKAGEMLLRASGTPNTAPEVLLRPATATTETHPEQLLRPGAIEN